MVARGDARLAYERHMAAQQAQQGPQQGEQAASAPTAAALQPALPHMPPDFNGYTIDVHGARLYLDPEAPLLAHATERASHLGARRQQGGSRVFLPSTPRSKEQQARQQAALQHTDRGLPVGQAQEGGVEGEAAEQVQSTRLEVLQP